MIKVAGYCRVSTDREDQANSFASQQQYFREYIGRNPRWELYEIYADEGITGTSTKKRLRFNQMMDDACRGKFSLILTKEVSRFSRNILDTIACTRWLKGLGVGVIFMSDGFSSLDPDAELRLSIMGSIAQEESRKTSTRVKWGQTRQMERGVVFGKSLLGYDVHSGTITINPEGAEIVRRIFYMYGIEKKGTTVIAGELQRAGYKTSAGNPNWSNSHILKILKNEKYAGDLIQKKTITPDYLTHEKKYNHGEEALVVLRDHHVPIVSRELWNLVQEEIKRRSRRNSAATGHSNRYIFSGKIRCAECGAHFISRVKYRKDGTACRRWCCSTAAREGKRKHNSPGGCDVGRQIRDELALQMLCCAIQSLHPGSRFVQNLTALIGRAGESSRDNPGKLQFRANQIRKKKSDAVDAFLSGILSQSELEQMKKRYDTELNDLQNRLKEAETNSPEQKRMEIRSALESMLACDSPPEAFLKQLLDFMIVHKDGRVELKLCSRNTVWHFRMEPSGADPIS